MRIVAFSDSHGNLDRLREGVLQALTIAPIDILVHCGDGARDVAAVEALVRDRNADARFYVVRGNCDMSAFDFPAQEVFEAYGIRCLATHGHLYHVKTELETLLSTARARSAQIVFFGHTHHSFLQMPQGVYLINPGAVANQLRGNVAYAQVNLSPAGVNRADLMPWLT